MGMETALHLAARGYRVYGSVCNETEQMSLAAEARTRNVTVEILQFDVTREDQVRPAIDSMLAATGRIDALVQFVGIGLRGFFEDLDISEIERVFQVNLFGLMRVTQAVLPHMRKAMAGRIILTSSVGGRMASMGIGGYASSKFAIEGWAESLHQEMAPFQVRVSLLEPGLIHTPHFGIHRNVSRRAADPGQSLLQLVPTTRESRGRSAGKEQFHHCRRCHPGRTHSGVAPPSPALRRRNESQVGASAPTLYSGRTVRVTLLESDAAYGDTAGAKRSDRSSFYDGEDAMSFSSLLSVARTTGWNKLRRMGQVKRHVGKN